MTVDDIAKQDHPTKDAAYNRGLRAIRKYGYAMCFTDPDVEYYAMCNGYEGGYEHDKDAEA